MLNTDTLFFYILHQVTHTQTHAVWKKKLCNSGNAGIYQLSPSGGKKTKKGKKKQDALWESGFMARVSLKLHRL